MKALNLLESPVNSTVIARAPISITWARRGYRAIVDLERVRSSTATLTITISRSMV